MNALDIIKDVVDTEVVIESCALAIGFGLSSLFQNLYNRNQSTCKEVGAARKFAIDQDLLNSVKENDKGFQYVAICGRVQADETTLKSRYFPEREGVILNFITEERKETWAKYSHAWYESNSELSNIMETVPFRLTEGQGVSVQITDPLGSTWCQSALTVINKEFREPNNSVMDSIFGLISGSRVKGYTDTEKMLQIGTPILGIGELVAEDNALKLKKPSVGEYIVTSATHADVVSRIGEKSRAYRLLCILFAGATLGGLYFFVKRLRKKYIAAIENRRRDEELREIRRQRGTAPRSSENASQSGHDENCVICLTNPRECVLLECGHICGCVDCIEMLPVPKRCPVCRSPISRIVPLFHA